jgi:hypothetical protein
VTLKFSVSLLAFSLAAACGTAQTAPSPEPQQPHGTVLFQSHGDAPEPDADRKPLTTTAPEIPDSTRAAVTLLGYDLEAHLKPAAGELQMHALLTLRNDGSAPLSLLPLQISSTLHFETISLAGGARTPVPFVEHVLETDLDHTGLATEAILTLPRPLAPGSTLTLATFYSGTLAASATRLTRIGANVAQASAADWDSLGPESVRLRGFGNVLWYPVSAPGTFLGDGNQLFTALGRNKLLNEEATGRLRLSVEFGATAPVAAWFAGRRQPLTALSDNSASPTAVAGGVATAEFPSATIGFRTLSLFVLTDREQPTQPASEDPNFSTSSSAGTPLLAVSTADSLSVPRLLALADEVSPLLDDWLGPRPLTPLTILNNPGQPWEDGALLVAPIDELASSDAASAMAYSLTHAWLQTGQPWIDEGFAQFLAIEWTERTLGRTAAIAKLQELASPLALGEPTFADAAALATAAPGEPLIHTGNDVFYRRKAAAAWFMLREIVGDTALKTAMSTLAAQPSSTAPAEVQATAFRKLLESISHKDLAAFFNDWVLHDRGLPDLTIVDVTPRPLPAGKGHDSGWLTAITVHNSGAAVAEVPVTVRAGTFTITRRMRLAGFASGTDRFLTEAQPTDVSVNDGTVVEAQSSFHTRNLVLHDK